MFERFTAPARQMVGFAQVEARLLEHNYLGSEHLLLGLLRAEEGVAADVLKDLGITLERVRDVVRIGGSSAELTSGRLRFTPRAKKVLELALREALAFRDGYITTAHILLALMRVGESRAARTLFDLGADAEHIGGEVLRLRSTMGGSWEEGAWEEPIAPGSTPAATGPPGPLSATAVRAVVEVALDAAATNAREANRPVDLGDLLLALVEGWPEDLMAHALAELEIDAARVREAVEVARRRGE
jgi:ATP-dependent Clp protease ATP-binding subunit ClpC